MVKKNLTLRNFRYILVERLRKSKWKDMTYSMRNVRYTQNFLVWDLEQRDIWGDVDVNDRMFLKWISRKWECDYDLVQLDGYEVQS